jgi:Flp pilus assembly protein TadD
MDWRREALQFRGRVIAPGRGQTVKRVYTLAAVTGILGVMLGGCTPSYRDTDLTSSLAASEPRHTASVEDADPARGYRSAASLKAVRDGDGDLALGKRHYRERNFGLAERYFRRAVEKAGKDAEAWIGLAATYDQLGRFELADRAYGQALLLIGPTPELLNNQGYSYMLRGDLAAARKTLTKAEARAPDNPYIKENLKLLAEVEG